MRFGAVAIAQSHGCILAHSMQLAGRRIKKGVVIDSAMVAEFEASGIERVTVARLDDTDTHENDAAIKIAMALCGTGVRTDKPGTGRVNLFAEHDGLLCFDREAIIAINSIDESITLATLPENSWVLSGKMVATCKIITYGVASSTVDQVIDGIGAGVSVQPVQSHRAVLIQTCLPTVKASVLDKTYGVIKQRLSLRRAELIDEQRCDHAIEPLSETLRVISASASAQCDWILIAGASAISDRGDVIPAAINAAGGRIIRYGLPVDPGNLLLLGELHGRVVIGLPGCARSPKLNGLDLLLDRLACGVEISQAWLNSLSVGGLLTEMLDRPQPRVATAKKRSLQIAGLVLAAGTSRRAGAVNKLLVKAQGTPMVQTVVRAVCDSKLQQVLVVTGHQHEQIEAQLQDLSATSTYCASHEQGMAHSLSHGISRLQHADAVLVCLADMPGITVALINRLIERATDNISDVILVPVHQGRRGNPVLVGRAFFDSLLQHSGDTGARYLMKQYPDRVIEVPVDDSAILIDYDTPQALSTLDSDVS